MAMTGVFVVAFIIVPSIAFCFAEPEWNFIDAIYFVFISLTTIGLGDYIPGKATQYKRGGTIKLKEWRQVGRHVKVKSKLVSYRKKIFS